MRAAVIIAGKDLRERIRDRSAIIFAVIAPFMLAAIFSLVLPSDDQPLDFAYVLVDLDDSPASTGFLTGPLTAVEEAGLAGVEVMATEDEARAAVEEDASTAVIIPAGFGAAIEAGEPAQITVVGNLGAGLATQIMRSLAEGYAAELAAIRLTVATTLGVLPAPPEPREIDAIVARAIDTPNPISLVDAEAELRQMAPSTYYAASMGIFFLFFTAQFGVLSLMTERRQGTLPRLLAAPIASWTIVAGKSLGTFVFGTVSLSIIAVASTFLLSAEWGPPIGVAALIVAAVIAAMGITALVTTLARTEEQAGSWNAIIAIVLGMLGGAFFDLSQSPELLSRLSFLTPHAWFLDGLDAMAAPSFAPADLLLPVGVLLAMGIVTGGIGMLRADRLVATR